MKGCLPMFAIEGSWKLKRDGATSRHLLGYRIPMLDGRTHSWKRHLRTPNIVIGRRRTKTKLSPRKPFYFHLISISEWRPVAALSNFPQKCFSILTGFQSKLQKLQNNFDCSSLSVTILTHSMNKIGLDLDWQLIQNQGEQGGRSLAITVKISVSTRSDQDWLQLGKDLGQKARVLKIISLIKTDNTLLKYTSYLCGGSFPISYLLFRNFNGEWLITRGIEGSE